MEYLEGKTLRQLTFGRALETIACSTWESRSRTRSMQRRSTSPAQAARPLSAPDHIGLGGRHALRERASLDVASAGWFATRAAGDRGWILDVKTPQVTSISGSNDMFGPRWSPDGRYPATLNLENVSRSLFLFDFQTGKRPDWVIAPETIQYSAWTSDSPATTTKRVEAGDIHPEQLFSMKGFPQYFVPEFGPWSEKAPDNSRILLDVSPVDIYSLDIEFP